MYVFRLLLIQNSIKGVWFEVANNEEKRGFCCCSRLSNNNSATKNKKKFKSYIIMNKFALKDNISYKRCIYEK